MIKYSLLAAALLVSALLPEPASAQFLVNNGGARPIGGPVITGSRAGYYGTNTARLLNFYGLPHYHFYPYYQYYGAPAGYVYGTDFLELAYGFGYPYDYVPIYVPYFSPIFALPDAAPVRYYPSFEVMLANTPVVDSGVKPRTTTASLQVYLPSSNAEVWFDGVKMQQTGQKREFVTPEITPGKVMTYDVRAKWSENGRQFDQTRTVTLQPGNQVVFAFYADDKEKTPPPEKEK